MQHKKFLFLFVSFAALYFCTTALSQSTSTIAKGRIITTDGTAIPFRNLTLGSDTFRYQPSSSGAYLQFPVDKTIKIEEQRGTKALETSGYMGGVMLGTMLVASRAAKKKYPNDKKSTTPIVLGATVGGILLGALIGSAQKKYVEVYSNPKFNSGFNFSKLQLQFAFGKLEKRVGFQYRL